MTKDVENFFKCLSAILDSSVESSLFRSVLHSFIGLFVLLMTIKFILFFIMCLSVGRRERLSVCESRHLKDQKSKLNPVDHEL